MTDEENRILFTIDDEPPPVRRRAEVGRRPVPLRWCALLLTVLVLTTVAAQAVRLHRGRTVTTVRTVAASGTGDTDVAGCPTGVDCAFLSGSAGSLLSLAQAYLPGAVELAGNTTTDQTYGTDYRSASVVRTPSGVVVRIVAECAPGGPAIPAAASAIPTTGPADIRLVTPGQTNGCSVAVSARVPAGVAVPVAGLRQLIGNPALGTF